MVEVSCKEKIMGSMHLLTNSESKIAKYVLDNFNETLNYNVSELADKAGVSDASVVRFVKALIAFSASFLESSAFSATAAINSVLFI